MVIEIEKKNSAQWNLIFSRIFGNEIMRRSFFSFFECAINEKDREKSRWCFELKLRMTITCPPACVALENVSLFSRKNEKVLVEIRKMFLVILRELR